MNSLYRIHHKGEPLTGDASAYHLGDAENSFDDLDEAIKTAQSLDETCDFDCEVVRFDSGLPVVVWG